MRTETRTYSEWQTWTRKVIILKPKEFHRLQAILRSHSFPDDEMETISIHGKRGAVYSIFVEMEGKE